MTGPQQNLHTATTILLVDDEPDIVALFKEVLEHAGHRVLASTRPTHALAIAGQAEEGIDLLLSDVMMPEMNGFELARRLRIDHPGLKVLLMSGYFEKTLPVDDGSLILNKPLSISTLCATISAMLEPGGAPSPPSYP